MLVRQYLLYFSLFLIASLQYRDSRFDDAKPNYEGPHGRFQIILDHYLNEARNQEKYDAACYLISNLEFHHSLVKVHKLSPLVRSSFDYLDSLVKVTYFSQKRQYAISDNKEFEITPSSRADFTFERLSENIANRLTSDKQKSIFSMATDYDVDSIDPKFLLNHIDNAFENWNKSKIANGLSWKEFYETLLSYRFRNEVVDIESSQLADILEPVIRSRVESNVEQIVNDLNSYLFYIDCFENRKSRLGYLGFFDALQFYNFECGRHSEWTARALNASGIPTHLDFTPSWLNRDRGHFWVAIRDQAGAYHPFTPKWQSLEDSAYFDRTSKVYRCTFDKQPGPGVDAYSEEVPHTFQNPFIKDVTDQYHQVVDIGLLFEMGKINQKYAYLCIFGAAGWQPIGWGQVSHLHRTINFKKVKTDVTYIAGIFKDGKIEPISHPFHIDSNGKTTFILPDFKNKKNLVLKSKFYEKEHLITGLNETAGAAIQIASRSDFSDAKNIYVLKKADIENMSRNFICFNSANSGKFLRIVAKEGSYVHLSEVELFSDEQGKSRIGAQAHYSNPSIANLMDRNLETFVMSKSIQLSLRSPSTVKSMVIAARTANNQISPGDRYQLFYYSDGWQSAGVKRAKNLHITFEGVPSNTIYWLRNIDHGREEQAFQYRSGRQYFINHDNFVFARE